MAKVTGPLMSQDASGAYAGTLVFSKWKGRNYVRQLVTPSNPQTTGQQNTRAALGAAGRFNSFVEPSSPAEVAEIAAAPSGQSGPSYFVKLQTQRFATSKTDYANGTYSTIKGYFDAAAATLGIVSVVIPGDSPLTVSGGLVLWNAYDAMHSIDDTLAPSTAETATSGNVDTFVDSLSA